MKSGTFTKMYVQLVFAVKNREAILNKNIRNQVFEYIGGINTNMKHKSIIVNGVSNHVHVLFGLNPSVSVSDTVYHIKRGSSLFINNEKLCSGHFSWQEGYGAFTYGHSQLDEIYKYIKNQEMHHAKESFRTEYISFLEKSKTDYDPMFLFDFFDDIL
jgi:REP element-mobilizing transposase RayT